MGMKVEKLAPFDEVLVVTPERFEDERGYFSQLYSQSSFQNIGIVDDFLQDNHSYSRRKGTVRGLHFQSPPFAQAKLVNAVVGSIWDVVVDIRVQSPTYGLSVAIELSADNGKHLYIPVGFAHGVCTLTDHAEIRYKVSAPYSKDHDHGIAGWSLIKHQVAYLSQNLKKWNNISLKKSLHYEAAIHDIKGEDNLIEVDRIIQRF